MYVPLLVLVLLGAALLYRRAAGQRPLVAPPEQRRRDVLTEAVEAGIITEEQESAIRALQAAEDRAPRRVPIVTEVLGYVGGVLVAIGGISLVAQFWDDLTTAARLATLGGTTLVLWGAGALVDEDLDPVLWRLRNVLWLLAGGALAGFASLLAVDGLSWEGEPVAVFAGSVVAAGGLALWQLRDRPGPHLVCLGGVTAAVIGAGAWFDGGGAIGLSLLAVGGGWTILGLAGRLPPEILSVPLGASVAVMGSGVTGESWPDVGPVLGLATAAIVLAAGTQRRKFLLTAVGVLGLFVYVPMAASHFFEDTLGVPVVMLVSGVVLLAVALLVLSRRGPLTGGGARPRAV